jgi:hypothetical protein
MIKTIIQTTIGTEIAVLWDTLYHPSNTFTLKYYSDKVLQTVEVELDNFKDAIFLGSKGPHTITRTITVKVLD